MIEETEPTERENAKGIFGVTLGLGLFAMALLVIATTRAEAIASPSEAWGAALCG